MSYYGNYGKGTYKGNYNYGKQQLTVEDVEKLIKAIVVGENEIIPGSIGAIHIKDGSINNAHIQHLAVGEAHIQEAAINRAHIADLAVSSAKIDDLAVTSAKIAESAIETAHIEDAAITNAKIADASIDTAKIQDATITTAKVADASITDAKIANAAIDTAHIKDAAITNAKIANGEIDTAKIADASITTAKIENGAITTALIAQGAIETAQIADGSITDAKIVELTANKIKAGTLDVERLRIVGPDSILYELNVNSVGELSASQYTLDGEGITERSITADKIVAKSITAAEIASRTITANEIAVNTITASSGVIADAAITTAKIADAAITNAKISNLDASKIKSGYISADRIAAGSITANKIASDSIESRHIKANSISTDKISSLTADKIVFDGHVFGENATFTGELQAVSGTFIGRVEGAVIEGSEIISNDEDGGGIIRISDGVIETATTLDFTHGAVLERDQLRIHATNAVGETEFSSTLTNNGLRIQQSFNASAATYSATGVFSKNENGVLTLHVDQVGNFNGNVSVNADGGYLHLGLNNTKQLVLMRYGRIVASSEYFRIFPGGTDANQVRIRSSDGQVAIYSNGTYRHLFNADGTKAGGSIEIDGKVLGMSPIDSPQVLLETIEFNIPLNETGVKVYLDERFAKSVDYQFAVFPNNGEIIEKGFDYFIIKGEGYADVRIVGERRDSKGLYYSDLTLATEEDELLNGSDE